jgi:hypothetical protein
MARAESTLALIESNAREAADLAGELVLLLDRAVREAACLTDARLVTRRLSDRLGQAKVLERLACGGGIRLDAWSPIEMVEELEHEALALAAGRLAVEIGVPDLAPRHWFFDRELVSMALHGALHSALAYAHARVHLEFCIDGPYLGFSIADDAGAFPAELLRAAQLPQEGGECNGNALGIHFARVVAARHAHRGRQGRIELENRAVSGGTRFRLWLP